MIYAARVGEDAIRVGEVVIAPEIRDGDAEAAGAELDSPTDFKTCDIVPGVFGPRGTREPEGREAVRQVPRRDLTGRIGNVGFATATEVGGLVLVEVEGKLEAEVLERPHFVEGVDEARGPERDA